MDKTSKNIKIKTQNNFLFFATLLVPSALVKKQTNDSKKGRAIKHTPRCGEACSVSAGASTIARISREDLCVCVAPKDKTGQIIHLAH